MLNKIINPLTVALYAFMVSYGVTSIFSRYRISDNTIINSIFILIITILIVIGTAIAIRSINRYLISKQQTDNK